VGKKDPTIAIKNLIFVGLITLRDPPRDEVPQAIKECYEASIKVVMVTGDHPLTAEAIARNIGLITQPTIRCVRVDDILLLYSVMYSVHHSLVGTINR
jgi:magnesium-transporting ATPase (P-type)